METAFGNNIGGGGGGGELRAFESVDELSTALVEHVALLSEAAVKERGSFSLVLSGGAAVLSLLQKLTKAPYSKTVDWSRWLVLWAEDNVVPKNHPDSHYKLAKEEFLSKVPVAPSKVVPTVATAQISSSQLTSGERAAEDYEFRIRQLVRSRTVDVSRSSDCPRFDLILLLLGADGGVAALYPDHPVLLLGENDGCQCPWVASVRPPAQQSSTSSSSSPPALRPRKPGNKAGERVTMTLPVINSAAHVAVVAMGTAVAEALASALDCGGGVRSNNIPAKLISPRNGKLVWFVDAAAASFL